MAISNDSWEIICLTICGAPQICIPFITGAYAIHCDYDN